MIVKYFHIEVPYTVVVFTPDTRLITWEFRLFTMIIGTNGKMTDEQLLAAPETTQG